MTTTDSPASPASLKRAAAVRALEFVQPGMKLGLGTGSTAEAFLDVLAPKVAAGLDIIGVPTSQRTADKAKQLGIPIAELDATAPLDLTIDGADEADVPSISSRAAAARCCARRSWPRLRPA